MGNSEYWDEFWALMDSVPMKARQEYMDNNFVCHWRITVIKAFKTAFKLKVHRKECLLYCIDELVKEA